MRPSSSNAPTYSSAEPSSIACDILADITCISEDNGSCDFSNPVAETCTGGNAQELRFIYTANSPCMGNNTQAGFSCVDSNTTRPSTVYIKASLGSSIFFEGIVNEGNIFSIFVTDDSNMAVIEIRELTSDFGAGQLLQLMEMSVQCREEDSLTLLDTFGGLQLVGYRNEDEGLKVIYTDLIMQYVATNLGNRNMLLTSAIKTTPMTGTQQFIFATQDIVVVPGESEIVQELLTVNLAAIVGGSGLDLFLSVKGEDAVLGGACAASDSYVLKVTDV